ncbi:16S rRNA methyltransferase [Pontibacillus halophilus JSM 076056 = DSM 19796]|uniref:Ribosomal RNA small subunit methyltransferase I n=1 Tax=Pontibacillus halophilus JSM 076056 = DSM 19796 TaxID=1385510 RepID=A0A0A5I2M3_9BACI|nr:16S rRNA (cytidine(1402)-2'-O)-methyltransferase [Pontibacillus halophilus]KGX90097.1 16S rRNA methyltransferase [Pontibacillus halophilus JSM 076056 = DSM 19796]
MSIQQSFQPNEEGYGALYIVPTPIGNLEDITYRALRILGEVDVIAAEDTRQTRKLMNHFQLSTPLISYHEHNKHDKEEGLIQQIKEGKSMAVVSDAGMPAVSDPGFDLVKRAAVEGIQTIVLPGANAALVALVGSGLDTERFSFYGFLPRKKKELKEELEGLVNHPFTLVFYESPHRIKETVKQLGEVFGDRAIALARELTKRYEEYARGTAEELLSWLNSHEVRGEFCIVVEGNSSPEVEEHSWWEHLSMKEHVEFYMEENMSSKDAIKQASKDRDVPKRDVYQAYHIDE